MSVPKRAAAARSHSRAKRRCRRAAAVISAAVVGLGAPASLAGCFERGSAKRSEREQPQPAQTLDAGSIATAVPAPPAAASPTHAAPPAPPANADSAASVAIGLPAEPAHLNPLLAGDAVAASIALDGIYEGLLCHGAPDQPPQPCLAERVRTNASQTEWTFALRRASWPDGQPVTPADVLFTFGLLSAGAPTPLRETFADLLSARALDERTVQFQFAGFRVGRRIDFADLPILPEHRFGGVAVSQLQDAPASRSPVGSGPFRFVAWRRGDAIELERFADHWRDNRGGVARVLYRFLPSRERALTELAAGELDLVPSVPVDEARAIAESNPSLRVFSYDAATYLAAVWNLRRPPLADPKVRRGLSLLLDRAGIIEQVFRGYASYVDGPFRIEPPDAQPHTSRPPMPFDPKAALELLRAAGDGAPDVELLVPAGSRSTERVADIWAADAAPGARLRVTRAPFSEVVARAQQGRFDAVLLEFPTGDGIEHYQRFHSSQVGGQNFGALADPTLDELLVAIRATADTERRRELERRAQARIAELQPYCFIAAVRRVGVAAARIGGILMTRRGLAIRLLWATP